MYAAPSPKTPRSLNHLLVLLAGIIGGPLLASITIDQPSFSYSQNFDTPDFAAEVARLAPVFRAYGHGVTIRPMPAGPARW
jgi:hypothetical protein